MKLYEFSVHRPVTINMIFLGIFLLGCIAWAKIPQELFPQIVFPQLSVVTRYSNAAPEEVETLVTKPIEESISTVKNIKGITSTSKEGMSMIINKFGWGTDMDFSALGMREKIDLIKQRLPKEADDPLVLKFNPFALPVMVLSLTGDLPLEDLLRLAEKIFKDKIEKIDGVASVSLSGGRRRQILVEINQAQLEASKINIMSVTKAIKDSNLNYPGGTTKEKFFEYLVRTTGQFEKISDIGSEVVISLDKIKSSRKDADKNRDKFPELATPAHLRKKERPFILLKDVATIEDTFEETTSYSRYNGKANISMSIQKQATANTIKTAQNVLKQLAQIDEMLPANVKYDIVYNQANFIIASIDGLKSDAVMGGVLAFLILFCFLKNLRNAAVVTLIIPVSVWTTFALMFFKGVSINTMSLSGLALGLGMLVDNAVVVIENVSRHQTFNPDPKKAVINATEEIAGPIFSSTLTTVAVFLPLLFVVGIAGQLFKDLSFTVVFSLTASLFAAQTLIPTLAVVKKGKPNIEKKPREPKIPVLKTILKYYELTLRVVLEWKMTFLFSMILLFVFSIWLFTTLNMELMPKVDQGQFTIKIVLKRGTRVEVTNNLVLKIEEVVSHEGIVLNYSTQVSATKSKGASISLNPLGTHQGQIMINLKKEREVTTAQYMSELKDKINKLNLKGVQLQYIITGSSFDVGGGEGGGDVSIEVMGPKLEKLKKLTATIETKLKSLDDVYGVKNSFPEPSPEARIQINKDRAALYGLSVKDIATACLTCIKGVVPTKFKKDGLETDIKVKLRKQDMSSMNSVRGIKIFTSQGFSLPLEDFAKVIVGKGPSEIKRSDQQRVIYISANYGGAAKNEMIAEMENFIKNLKVEEGYSASLGGETEEMRRSMISLILATVMAITLVYMIMASQFESLWQPFIIMFTVPLSIIGVALTLWVTNTPVSVVSLLGIIMLAGIVVNNGIVLIEYINDLRKEGVELKEAIVLAGKTRYRPIAMTTMTTLLGLFPLALGLGEGAELRSPMAKTILGGLAISTFLTLYVIPALLLLSENLMANLRLRKG
ncbi:efflux RND transporter permease subunit [Candidatus Auribacterota bacterium]